MGRSASPRRCPRRGGRVSPSQLLPPSEAHAHIRPVRFPLSVFVMSEMLELAQAHATYRFILSDEESNKPRALLWLFNPSVNISYRRPQGSGPSSPRPSTSASITPSGKCGKSRRRSLSRGRGRQSALAAEKTIKAAKVLYKLVEGEAGYVFLCFLFRPVLHFRLYLIR